jgi:hypothetical protein
MIERINKNEERLDSSLLIIKKMRESLVELKNNKQNIYLLNKYYGSKNWFKDKDAYEKNLIPKIKAGVLSEDLVWNVFEDLKELINEMQDVITDYARFK